MFGKLKRGTAVSNDKLANLGRLFRTRLQLLFQRPLVHVVNQIVGAKANLHLKGLLDMVILGIVIVVEIITRCGCRQYEAKASNSY